MIAITTSFFSELGNIVCMYNYYNLLAEKDMFCNGFIAGLMIIMLKLIIILIIMPMITHRQLLTCLSKNVFTTALPSGRVLSALLKFKSAP